MANFREWLVRGGRAYVDSGDVAAVLIRGEDVHALAPPEQPIRFLLSGCGDTVDIFGVSVHSLFDGEKPWLDPSKFLQLHTRSGKTRGRVFIHSRHVVGLIQSGASEVAKSSEASPLSVIIRGASQQITCWGPPAIDFLFWLQSAGRQVQVTPIDKATWGRTDTIESAA